jgi:type IV pilus assembly protein PilA
MVSALESCYTNSQTYVGCGTAQDVTESGITTGTGNGQVNLATLASSNFVVAAKSESGNTFTITKPASGAITRTCTTTGSGACPNSGNW